MDAAEGSVLQVRGLTSARTPPAFLDVDLSLIAGEATAVVGPSGGGKTALLRALLGLDPVARGRIAWFGAVCGGDAAFRAVRRRLGVVFADGGLLGSARTDVNVAWGLGAKGAGADRPEVAELLERLELRGDLLPDQLSPWQRKRVGLARALVGRPEVVLIDGPFDPHTTAQLDALVSAVYWPDLPLPTRASFVPSVPASSMSAERLVVLGSGGTVAAGTRDEVLASDDPDVQMLLGRLAGGAS